MQSVASKDLSDREVELLQRVKKLENALGVTLDYIQSELQPNPPANIAQYRDLLDPEQDRDITFDVINEFLGVVTSMARFLSNSSAMETFMRGGTSGFAYWVVLATVAAQPPGLVDRQLTRFIGTSLKRTRRLLEGLSNTGMVLLSPGIEPETSILEITPAGQARLREVEAELLPILKQYLGENRLQFLFTVSLVRRLSRIHDRARHGKR